MAETSSRSRSKRPFVEDEDSEKPPAQKKVRFPKGKKVKPGETAAAAAPVEVEDIGTDKADSKARRAAKERAQRRIQITTELLNEDGEEGTLDDVYRAEVAYEENENFVEDGIQIEPFNLSKEKEEGYFDEQGNFVEYVKENEIKDAWLDSIDNYPKAAGVASTKSNNKDEVVTEDLSSEEIGSMKRRIANVLEPGETVLRALRRLKGSPNNRKQKMLAETKLVFDQLTEDAMKLMDNGDYNVYHEKQEDFEREAEGYERLAQARGKNTSDGNGFDMFSDMTGNGVAPKLPGLDASTSGTHANAAVVATNGTNDFDMFADDEENAKQPSEHNSVAVDGSASSEARDSESDYVYDDSSGYYYSSISGYYYDPRTGLYCSAASGQWYSFNEATGAYEEIPTNGAAPLTN